MMNNTPIIEQDDSYNKWIRKLEQEIDKLRTERDAGENDGKTTLHKVASHSDILQYKIHSQEAIMAFFEIFVRSLINPIRVANRPTDGVGLRPCELWEYFAEYYLNHININCLPDARLVKHTGQRNDRGVDVLCEWPPGRRAVVQVKRGNFFSKGKGTDIILKLIGSMFISDAQIGIIFTNESYENDVKPDAKDIVQIAMQRNLVIEVLGIHEIIGYASRDTKQCKRLMVKFIRDFFPVY